MKPQFLVTIHVKKPIAEVFDAVVNPDKLKVYFICTSTGPLVKGATVMWQFADHPGEFPVKVIDLVPNSSIELQWNGDDESYMTTIDMKFEAVKEGVTKVAISETGWNENDAAIKSSYRNCGGWMHMACCMKAYLEFGINLRTGSF